MPSLNLDINYFDHVKTLRLISRLGHGSDVLPIRLWVHVAKHHPETGVLALLDSEIEHICGWWGEKGDLVNALIETNFVKRAGDNYEVNGWLEHSGHLAAFKKRAIKAAQKRWGIKRKRSNATSIAKQEPKQCPSRAVPFSAVQDVTKPNFIGAFAPPTPKEAEDYAASIGFKLDGEAFVAYYEKTGWMIKGQKIKRWQSCVVTWKKNEGKFNGKSSTARLQSNDPGKYGGR